MEAQNNLNQFYPIASDTWIPMDSRWCPPCWLKIAGQGKNWIVRYERLAQWPSVYPEDCRDWSSSLPRLVIEPAEMEFLIYVLK